jgi:hypothetical protein
VQVKEFTFNEFEDIIWVVEDMKKKIMDADPNLNLSTQILCGSLSTTFKISFELQKMWRKKLWMLTLTSI